MAGPSDSDVIAAVGTAPGRAGIGIVRVSGKKLEQGEGAHGQAELEDPEAVAEKGPGRLVRVEGLFLTVPICHTDIPPGTLQRANLSHCGPVR